MNDLKFWEKKSGQQASDGAEPAAVEDTEAQTDNDDMDDEQKRKVESMHYGDPGYNEYLDDPDEGAVAATSWNEVFRACCCHTPKEWGMICVNILLICFFLYFFIFALELLGSGAKVLTGCAAAGLFGDNTNPVAALIVGMLVTVLLQSSSTTTSIIVSLVGSGAISVEPAIYMVMGANIGTSVTNTIVAMGEMGNGEELERAFAGATVHDCFNFLTVLIFFPLEIITHMLARMTSAMTANYQPNSDGEKKSKGIKAIIAPLLDLIIKSNKKVIDEVAQGITTCDDYYPTECNPSGTVNYEACVSNGQVGLITCSKDTGKCPAFFAEGASQRDDTVSGGACLFLGIVFLVMTLMGLVWVLKKMLLGASTRIIRKATNINGYISMLIGCGITILVQSSSVTTSVLTPLVGVGIITVEQMYPLTLGANIGTTITSILAATVASSADSMQVALAHFFFNIFGVIVWYPLPFMRRVPIAMAKALGTATKWWRGFPILYIAVVFFLIPLLLLGISALFTGSGKGATAFGVIIVIFLAIFLFKFLWWWFRSDGMHKTKICFEARQNKREVMNAIPLEWKPLTNDVDRLKTFTGLPDEEEDDEDDGELVKADKEVPESGGTLHAEDSDNSAEEQEVVSESITSGRASATTDENAASFTA